MNTSRRDFIKISSIGLGATVLVGAGLKMVNALLPNSDNKPLLIHKTPTYCEVCFWQCAGWVSVSESGDVVKIEGNIIDQHCNGRFCPRGTGGVGMYSDKDRITTPLIRVGEKGSQNFKPVTWDEALDYIAGKMITLAKDYGPEFTALFTHGSGGKFWGHLLKAYGSNSIAAPSYAQCRGPREAAWIATFGEELGSPEPADIRDTKCLVLIGSHLGENMHNGQVQEMSDAIDKGAVIITVDPRFSTAAGKSKYWLPIKPSTDIALLLAWMQVLISEKWYDVEYVEKYTHGFDQLKAHVETFTPEWAYSITGIKPDEIRRTAREMFNAAPSVIVHPGRHVTWYGDDTQRLRCVAILNALLGSWGRRGGFYAATNISIPDFPHPPYPKPKWGWQDAMQGRYPLADTALASAVCEATIPLNSNEHNYKSWIVNGANLIFTLPDIRTTLKAIDALELLVVIDTMPMEITGYADVILPECTYLERYDSIRASKHREANLSLRMPAVEPLGDSKPGWWMTKELGKKLGLGEYFNYENLVQVLDWQLTQVGSSLKELQAKGVVNYSRTTGDLYFCNGEPVAFNTNTGKIELYATSLIDAGFDPLPMYKPHPEPPEGFYRLNYGRAPMHTFSRTANNAYLTDLMDENHLWINPNVAKQFSLENGQPVWLENQDGIVSSFPIKVRITERIRFDSVYMVHGFGHKNDKLTRAHGRGASDSELITNVMVDPIMGGTGMRGNFVTFHVTKPLNKTGLL